MLIYLSVCTFMMGKPVRDHPLIVMLINYLGLDICRNIILLSPFIYAHKVYGLWCSKNTHVISLFLYIHMLIYLSVCTFMMRKPVKGHPLFDMLTYYLDLDITKMTNDRPFFNMIIMFVGLWCSHNIHVVSQFSYFDANIFVFLYFDAVKTVKGHSL